ncbi:MAG: DNA-methyltransferase [Dethiobacteria bacterium]|jgi:DNA modification methylase
MKNGRAKRQSTRTSSFGIGGRSGHDSSEFYSGRLYSHVKNAEVAKPKYIENEISRDNLDQIYCKSSESMDDIPDDSVHLMITSPPYNVKKEYDEDLTLDEYMVFLRAVFKETYKKLIVGGRACINIANIGRKPYIPLHSYVIREMLDLGFTMRGEIIWDKGASAVSSTAWGSWMSASNPVLRDTHEYILVFSKASFSRRKKDKTSTIQRNEFLEWTKSIWTFPAVSAKSIGHPAPFPEELPKRLIQLYSFEADVILDPFCGSGTTCLAALKSGRKYIGYDIKSEYVGLAKDRIQQYLKNQGK